MKNFIIVNEISRGRFGNKLLQVINTLQISNKLEAKTFITHWDGCNVFNELEKYNQHSYSDSLIKEIKNNSRSHTLVLDSVKYSENNLWNDLNNLLKTGHIVVGGSGSNMMLHNVFFDFANVKTKSLLSVKESYKYKNFKENYTRIGIHIRGGDVSRQGDREYHLFEYYRESIDFVCKQFNSKNIWFYICSDDVKCKTFLDTIKYIRDQNLNFSLGPATENPVDNYNHKIDHIGDFTLLTECDVLIASSSTYAICAGLIGKDKKIIHSKIWIDKNTPGETYVKWGNYTSEYPESYWRSWDNFWVNVGKGHDMYKIWKLI